MSCSCITIVQLSGVYWGIVGSGAEVMGMNLFVHQGINRSVGHDSLVMGTILNSRVKVRTFGKF